MTTEKDTDPTLAETDSISQDVRLTVIEDSVNQLAARVGAVEVRVGAVETKQRRLDKLVLEIQLENRQDNKKIEAKLDQLLEMLQPRITVP